MLSLKQLSLAENICGGLSAFGCFLVLITFATFPDLRKKRYAELVFYVSINIFVASIGISLGNVTSTGACWFQMITTNYNYLSAIFWTSVITLQVYLIVHYKRALSDNDMRYLHIVCWIFPLIVTFLPLTTNTVGETDDATAWCYISERANSPKYGLILWEVLSFYLWVWIAIVANIACIVSIALHLRRMAVVNDSIYQTMQKLIVYPVILIFCWTGSTLIDVYSIFHTIHNHKDWRILSDTTTIICILQGVLLSLSYFNLNSNICDLWYTLYMVTFVDKAYQGRAERRESQDAINMREWRRTRGSKRSLDGGDHPEWGMTGANNIGGINNNSNKNTNNENSREEGQGESGNVEATTSNSIFEIADRTYASEDLSMYYTDEQHSSASSSFTPGSSFRDSEWGEGGAAGGAGSSSSSTSALSLSVNDPPGSGGAKKQRARSIGRSSSSGRSGNVILTPIRTSVAVVVEERDSQVAAESEEGGRAVLTESSEAGSSSSNSSSGHNVISSESINPLFQSS